MQFWLHLKVKTKICKDVKLLRKDFFVRNRVAMLSIRLGIGVSLIKKKAIRSLYSSSCCIIFLFIIRSTVPLSTIKKSPTSLTKSSLLIIL